MLQDESIPFAVVATKSDKVAKLKLPACLEKLSAGLGVKNKNIYSFSSLKKTGIEDILSWIDNQIL